ncbi:MAG: penicillin-binding protein 2 [Micropruina sp.]
MIERLIKAAGSRPRGKVRRWPLAPSVRRLRMMLLVIAIAFSMAAGRALQVQALDATAEAEKAADQMTVSRPLPAIRGSITDRFGDVLAYTEPTVRVIADPMMIQTNGKFAEKMTENDKQKAAVAPGLISEILARHLGGEAATYLPQVTRPNSRYVILAKKVSSATFQSISSEMTAAKLIGLYRETAPTRRYPNGTLASNVIGFVNEEGTAAGGLEVALNKSLSGKDGREVYDSSPNGKIPLGDYVLTPPVNGKSYELTLDSGLQWQTEQLLANQVQIGNHIAATAVVLSVKTGEVLSMANYPTFDSNDPGSGKAADLGNRAITSAYEPGSVQKVLSFAAMLDSGLITPDTVLTVPPSVKSGDFSITDAFSHGKVAMTATGILAKSSNIGTLLLARGMKKEKLVEYLRSFGLGQRTGIGLPGEGTGSLPGATMPDYTRDSVAFGMGLSVTAIQEAAAIAAIANGGVYNRPTLIRSVTAADGTKTSADRPEPRRVVSPKTATQVAEMMEQVVANSVTGVFTVDGYRTAAKTGTAYRVDPACKCYKGLFTSTIGFGPLEDPEILVYVVVETKDESGSGSRYAAPVYADILRLALPRYGVPLSPTKSVKKPLFG